jgi:uncharacterized protein YdaU (DUF1376 family)
MYIDESSKPTEKLKAWYLFTDDFIAGTQHLSNRELGIYIRLLCWNWNKNCKGIPNDKNIIYRIAYCFTEPDKFATDKILEEFFVNIQDTPNIRWQNLRQVKEWLYINNKIENARENGKKGGRPKKNQTETPLPLTPAPNKNINIFVEEVWNKLTLKRGSRVKAFEIWKKLKIENNILIEKYNALWSKTDEEKFMPHFYKWLKDCRWEDELSHEKKNDLGIYSRDRFANLESWKKGRRYPLDSDQDIIEAYKQGKITKEAMEKMSIYV